MTQYLTTLLSIETSGFQNYTNFIAIVRSFQELRTIIDGFYYTFMILKNKLQKQKKLEG